MTDASTAHPYNGSILRDHGGSKLGHGCLADGDGPSAAEDPADAIQVALERWRDDFNARPATGIDVIMGADHFLLQIGIGSAIFGRPTLTKWRNSMRVPAIVLMGIVLSGCVSSSEVPSQPVPPANLGSKQAAPLVPPAPISAALPPGYTRHITYRDGRFTLPDGSTVPADPNGGFTISTGAHIPPDGSGGIILPNGARCISDSARGYFCP